MSEPLKMPETAKGLTQVGIVASAAWLVVALVYLITKRSAVFEMAPNEVGDFLAGCFAPLAFFWLVLGFFQQGAELRNSGQALWLQGEELRNSVEQQRQLVDVTREQLQFESRRMSAEFERQKRLAQPRLALELGGWSGSQLGRLQRFYLINYGRPCTQIEIGFTGDWSPIKQNHLGTGDRLDFEGRMKPGHKPVVASISYLDEQMEAGVARFEISLEHETPSISELLESVTTSPQKTE